MNYPYGPYGQGFPGQPGYPPPLGPGFPPPPGPSYPPPLGYPGGQQPYPLPPAPNTSPSAVTGVIAAVLAGLGGVGNVVGGLVMAFGLAVMISESTYDVDTGEWTGLTAITMLNIVAGVLLSVGTVMLLFRKMTSRWIVVAGCAVSIVSTFISLAMPSTFAEYQYSGKGADVVGLIFPIATIVLVLLPSTAAWIRAKQNGAPPPPHWG
jgi:hypothetical protein